MCDRGRGLERPAIYGVLCHPQGSSQGRRKGKSLSDQKQVFGGGGVQHMVKAEEEAVQVRGGQTESPLSPALLSPRNRRGLKSKHSSNFHVEVFAHTPSDEAI